MSKISRIVLALLFLSLFSAISSTDNEKIIKQNKIEYSILGIKWVVDNTEYDNVDVLTVINGSINENLFPSLSFDFLLNDPLEQIVINDIHSRILLPSITLLLTPSPTVLPVVKNTVVTIQEIYDKSNRNYNIIVIPTQTTISTSSIENNVFNNNILPKTSTPVATPIPTNIIKPTNTRIATNIQVVNESNNTSNPASTRHIEPTKVWTRIATPTWTKVIVNTTIIPTGTFTPFPTRIPTRTFTPIPTNTETNTPLPTNTATYTPTPTNTLTPIPCLGMVETFDNTSNNYTIIGAELAQTFVGIQNGNFVVNALTSGEVQLLFDITNICAKSQLIVSINPSSGAFEGNEYIRIFDNNILLHEILGSTNGGTFSFNINSSNIRIGLSNGYGPQHRAETYSISEIEIK